VATDRHPVGNHQQGLAKVERIALHRVGVVGQAHAQVIGKLGQDRCRQRALKVEGGALLGDPSL
jgi:hypothetical protein